MGSINNNVDNCEGITLVALTSSISVLLAENLSLDDQNIVGNVLQGIGQSLLIIAAQNSKSANLLQACKNNNIQE